MMYIIKIASANRITLASNLFELTNVETSETIANIIARNEPQIALPLKQSPKSSTIIISPYEYKIKKTKIFSTDLSFIRQITYLVLQIRLP